MLYDLAREALFKLDPEQSHDLTLALLSRFPALAVPPLSAPVPHEPVELMGLAFRNRVGLAAGLDKNGDCIAAFDRIGFGFIEIGTVTPRPQPGNPKPRMFRLPRQQALINRLGFNNKGVDHLVERVKCARPKAVLGINIGKNAATPVEDAGDDYEACLRRVYPHAGYVTVNISSPNTQNLRDLQESGRLKALLERLARARRELADRHGRHVPVLVKIAPDLEAAALTAIARTVRESGASGLIATNTTIERPGLDEEPVAKEAGGLSGAPLKPRALAVLAQLRRELGPDFPLVGVGGILSGSDAAERRAAGADLVQLYTGFIYKGPPLVRECARSLLNSRDGESHA
jgi:dihydroorotate dehydrogenase